MSAIDLHILSLDREGRGDVYVRVCHNSFLKCHIESYMSLLGPDLIPRE